MWVACWSVFSLEGGRSKFEIRVGDSIFWEICCNGAEVPEDPPGRAALDCF